MALISTRSFPILIRACSTACPTVGKERWLRHPTHRAWCPWRTRSRRKVDGTYGLFRVVMYHYYPGDVVVSHNSIYIREDWANAVGFEIKDAYTASELLEYARLIKEQDPGQVGANLVPIASDTGYLAEPVLRRTIRSSTRSTARKTANTIGASRIRKPQDSNCGRPPMTEGLSAPNSTCIPKPTP